MARIQQGRIRYRVRIGKGSDDINQLSSWAGAVALKPPVNADKSIVLRTDRPSGRRTERVQSRVRAT